jgi:50S ribosomal protein L16 3-hydroxylase
MTYSIGMRAPQRGELAAQLAQRLAEGHDDPMPYRDPRQSATARPAEIPPALAAFAGAAVQRLLARPATLARALGEVLSEPKPHVWFEKATRTWRSGGVALDRRTRMLYDTRHVFINGEAVRVNGRAATLLRRLADDRRLDASAVRGASPAARKLLREWFDAGWLRATRR